MIGKNCLEIAQPWPEVAFVSTEYGLSERTACKLAGVERYSYRHEPKPRTTWRCVRIWRNWLFEASLRLSPVACAVPSSQPRGECEAVYRVYVEE